MKKRTKTILGTLSTIGSFIFLVWFIGTCNRSCERYAEYQRCEISVVSEFCKTQGYLTGNGDIYREQFQCVNKDGTISKNLSAKVLVNLKSRCPR
jgi:hypothetical protein